MTEQTVDIAIVGGGASGMAAALSAQKRARSPLRILLLEKQNRVGRKLAATGNGRCNLTNMRTSLENFHTSGSKVLIDEVINAFPPEDVLSFFRELGVYPVEREEGRVYPLSDQAGSVVDALRFSLAERGIEVRCDVEVSSIMPCKGGFRLSCPDHSTVFARRVILATGGLAAPKLGGCASGYQLAQSLGHTLTPRFPALTTLKTETENIRALKGCKYSGEVSLRIAGKKVRSETGEILFTEYGLSGIAVMQLSRWASQAGKQPVEAELNLLPLSYEETLTMLFARRKALSKRPLEEFLTGLLNKRLGQVLVRQVTSLPMNSPAEMLDKPQLQMLSSLLTGWRLRVTGVQGYDQAQVTAGGVRTDEVNPQTLESRKCRGLYLCGELLDVDGDCGGFNLQWAWSSGLLAGAACATVR